MHTAPTYPTPQQIQALYETREEAIQYLSQHSVITLEAAADLDRLGFCRLAEDHWPACADDLRQHLLNHEHHSVRSCATLAKITLDGINEGAVTEQTQDELKSRLRDLDRRGAVMAADEAFQERIRVPGSTENRELADLNVQLFKVRGRLKHHFGYVAESFRGNWLI